jgi:hypothetical protein
MTLDREKLINFCKRHQIVKLSLFGSVLRDDFGPESDVDFLAVWDPALRLSYFDIISQEEELSEIIGRKADLRSPGEISRYFRQRVLDQAEPVYDAV